MKKLLFLAALIGLIVAASRKAQVDREQWEGLTEDEVRSRLDQRLPNQIPGEKRQMITDKIVTKMKDRGTISDETIDADEPIDLADGVDTTVSVAD